MGKHVFICVYLKGCQWPWRMVKRCNTIGGHRSRAGGRALLLRVEPSDLFWEYRLIVLKVSETYLTQMQADAITRRKFLSSAVQCDWVVLQVGTSQVQHRSLLAGVAPASGISCFRACDVISSASLLQTLLFNRGLTFFRSEASLMNLSWSCAIEIYIYDYKIISSNSGRF